MRSIRSKLLPLAIFTCALVAPAGAATVQEVVDRHIEARGGQKSWDAVRSMRVTGIFTAFSKESPFTLHRKRDFRYHMDHVQDDKLVVIGYDGESAWWDNHWFQVGAQPVEGADLDALRRDFDFVTPFFDIESAGHRVKLLGDVEFEGYQAIGVELTRADDTVETWYLDPSTYLELGRESPGSDFGRAMTQRTFFDDFRKVGKLTIPHYVETQWYTRDRVMKVDKVEIDPEIDDELFRMPAPPGMGELRSLVGSWNVAAANRGQPGAPWSEAERSATIESLLGGSLLQERFTTSTGNDYLRTYSFDRVREKYRLTSINARDGLQDVQEGLLGEDGRMVVSNLETGTTNENFGMVIHVRTSLFDIQADSFEMEVEVSIDGGENWFVAAKSTYTRAEAP